MTPSSRSIWVPPKLTHPFEWVWTTWLLSLIASFAAIEGAALHRNQLTLSRYIWNLSKAWPPFPWVAGIFVGGLIVHLTGWAVQETPTDG